MSCGFVLDGALDSLDGVHVLHLGTYAVFCTALGTDRKVYVTSHGTVCHFALCNTSVTEEHLESFEICLDLSRAGKVGLAYDLDKRNACTVEVNVCGVLSEIVNELTCILLHVDLLDTNTLLTCRSIDLNGTVHRNGSKPLCGLICRGKVGIVVALFIKCCNTVDVTVQHHTRLHTEVNHSAVYNGKHTGHTTACGAYVIVRLSAVGMCGA